MRRHLDLTLILELWEESLILLKRRLHWEAEDLLQVKSNPTDSKGNLKERNVRRLRRLLWPEYMAYEHFRRELLHEISTHRVEVNDFFMSEIGRTSQALGDARSATFASAAEEVEWRVQVLLQVGYPRFLGRESRLPRRLAALR